MDPSKKSLAHLADKFNTAPPPGYVAGRGRGVGGFSKPSADDLKHSRGGGGGRSGAGNGASAGAGGAAASSSSSTGGAGPAAAAADGTAGKGEGLDGDVSDTRANLDLAETSRFEEAELSMDSKEAGNTIEAFSMNDDKKEGHFDDDFNFVWKRKGEDPDDVHDAWLDGDVDKSNESAEKVEKRRRLLQQHLEAEALRKQDAGQEAVLDKAAMLGKIVGLLQPGETVAAALRRLGAGNKKAGAGGGAAGGKRKLEATADADPDAASRRRQFEELTEAADALLRGGRYDIYTEKADALQEELGSAASASSSSAVGDEAAAAATAAGIDAQTHAMAVAGGFAFDSAHRVYYNATSGLYFDPATSLYWSAPSEPTASPTYYYWDGASGQFVPAAAPKAEE